MCSRYRIAKFQDCELPPIDKWNEVMPSFTNASDIFPAMPAPVVAIGRSRQPTAVAMRWGFKDVEGHKVHLTRIESIRAPYWKGWERAVVPAAYFVEPDWQGHNWSYGGPRDIPLWLAGWWQQRSDGLCYTLFSKPEEKPVSSGQHRMVCPLTWEEATAFLGGGHPPGRKTSIELRGMPVLIGRGKKPKWESGSDQPDLWNDEPKDEIPP